MSNNGYKFENSLRKALDRKYPNAFVHRIRQNRFTPQEFDLVVVKESPFFVEAKSRDISDRKTLRLDTLFHDEQLEKQQKILDQTGLDGYLALEMRKGRGHPKKAVLCPLEKCSSTRVDLEKLDCGVNIKRDNGKYTIPVEF